MTAAELKKLAESKCVLVDRGALQMVINALRRDAEEGKAVRGEMADTLEESANPAAILKLLAINAELVEALKGLDEAYCRAGPQLTRDERNMDRKRLIIARAALAKAEGGEL